MIDSPEKGEVTKLAEALHAELLAKLLAQLEDFGPGHAADRPAELDSDSIAEELKQALGDGEPSVRVAAVTALLVEDPARETAMNQRTQSSGGAAHRVGRAFGARVGLVCLLAAVSAVSPVRSDDAPAKKLVSWKSDLESARREAIAAKRPIFVRIGGPACPWCRKLEQEIEHADVQAELGRFARDRLDLNVEAVQAFAVPLDRQGDLERFVRPDAHVPLADGLFVEHERKPHVLGQTAALPNRDRDRQLLADEGNLLGHVQADFQVAGVTRPPKGTWCRLSRMAASREANISNRSGTNSAASDMIEGSVETALRTQGAKRRRVRSRRDFSIEPATAPSK
jgi:hypothetical protein